MSVAIARTDRLSGGDINKSYALTLNTGDRIFMKANAKENSAFFTAEAAGLSAIAATGAIGTPRILCTGTDDGEAILIDPATYIGHAEADLAMTELFGGFPPAFYAAYREAHPLQSGYEKRRDLNMFGQTYLGAVQTIVGEYVG